MFIKIFVMKSFLFCLLPYFMFYFIYKLLPAFWNFNVENRLKIKAPSKQTSRVEKEFNLQKKNKEGKLKVLLV